MPVMPLEPGAGAGCHATSYTVLLSSATGGKTYPGMCMETVADVKVRHPKLGHEDSTAGDVRQLLPTITCTPSPQRRRVRQTVPASASITGQQQPARLGHDPPIHRQSP